MKDECLICGAPLEYLEKGEQMRCALCGREASSRARCVNGHFVCDGCHTKGMDAVVGVCLRSASRDPLDIVEELMRQPFCHMHGPEHHVLVGSALLTAYKNAGGEIDLPAALAEMQSRGAKVPGGTCGYWGACGAGISAGMFISIITKSSPLSETGFKHANLMTARALSRIGEVGGPRCCKRDSYLAILAAAEFVRENFGIVLETHEITCTHAHENNQCIGARCPFSPAGR